MIRLGLRLTLASGREAWLRVVVTAAAVALGVGLLLAALAAANGLEAQTQRGAWLDTAAQTGPRSPNAPPPGRTARRGATLGTAAPSELSSTPGVTGVTIVHELGRISLGNDVGAVACAQMAKTPAIGRCAPGATAADVGYFLSSVLGHDSHASTTTWPAAHLSLRAVAQLPVDAVVVATNGSPGAFERSRTALEKAFPFQGVPVGVDALDPGTERELVTIEDMTDVIIVASLVIAACSLAVNIGAGLGERRRPFSLLRLTGVSTRLLHGVVALESAAPLVLVAAVSIVVGFVSAALYLHSQVGMAFSIPGTVYWSTVLCGPAASLVIIAVTFPLLDRITGPEVARNG